MEVNKYLAALEYESPDTVLGSIMSELQFPQVNGIADACDVLYDHPNPHDLKLIQKYQPMFFNIQQHRLINQTDVINILQNFNN